MSDWRRVFIAVGSNLGDREQTIRSALSALAAHPSIRALRASTLHETVPVGGPAGAGYFLNAAASLETTLTPRQLLELLLRVEQSLGRVRAEKWGPRTIDLDIALYEDQIIHEPGLDIPHPHLHERRFVLAPLAEIAPNVRHPVIGRTIAELAEGLGDQRRS